MNKSMIKEKMNFFLGKNILLHIVKTDKEWLNCFILKKKANDIYLVNESKFGLLHLFLDEIYNVNEKKQEQEIGGICLK